MLEKHSGIVLHQTKYNDKSVIVHLFTQESGRMSVIVPIQRTRRSNIRISLFQPLNIIEFEIEHRPGAELYPIRNARLQYIYSSIPYHPIKASIAMFLSEFLYRTLQTEESDSLLYRYLTSSILWLDTSSEGFANFHIVFLLRFTRFLGFYPNLDNYTPGMCFDMLNSCFTVSVLPGSPTIGPDESEKIQLIMRMNYDQMHRFRLSRTERNHILEVCMQYYRLHVPDMPELKSFGVLKELFSTL